MSGLGTIRSVLASVVLALAVLPACSTHGQSHTQEQDASAGKPTRSESSTKETMEAAGETTLVVLAVGVGLAVAALPIVLVILLL